MLQKVPGVNDIEPIDHLPEVEGDADPVSTFVDTRLCRLQDNMTVGDALQAMRHQAETATTIYYGYVVDDNNALIGVISIRQLLMADENKRIADIIQRDVVFTYADEDQENAASTLLKHDLISLPIVTRDGQLLGILTRKTANRIMAQEQTEDFEKMMAIGGRHKSGVYLKTTAFEHFRKRVFWVSALAVLGFVSGYILHSFEETLAAFIILALYIPMVADTGGNTGSQSATVVIRAIALGEVNTRDAMRVLFKELRVSLMLAVILGCITFAKIMLLSGGQADDLTRPLSLIAVAITLAIMLQVVSSNIIGSLLPLLVARFNLDPATVASPALTTIVDITGLLIFFSLATRVLGIH